MDVIRRIYRDLTHQAHAGLISNLSQKAELLRSSWNGRDYWIASLPDGGRKYIGPDTDEMRTIIKACGKGGIDALKNRIVVDGLKANGFPFPDCETGAILADFAKAGLFRLRGVLVGTLAFQCYLPMLDVREEEAFTRTGDIDISQFSSVSIALSHVETLSKRIGDILGKHGRFLQSTDGNKYFPKWKKIGGDLAIDVITPYYGNEKMAQLDLPSLRTSGMKLKFLDFLIYDEMPGVVLHDSGIPVNIPRPERYCVHKILVAFERKDSRKWMKDIRQCACLLKYFLKNDPEKISMSLSEALSHGKGWRNRIDYMFRSSDELKPYSGWYEDIVRRLRGKTGESHSGMPLR